MDRETSFTPGNVSGDDALSIFTASRVAMVLTNPRLDDNPIIFVNRAFEDLTGYTAQMAVGRNCRFLQGDGTDRDIVARMRTAIAKGEDVGLTLTNYRADGSAFLNSLLITPVIDEDSGAIAYFLGLQREVNEDHARDDRLHFEDLIAELQHRVKNHLSMILGLIRLNARNSGAEKEFATIGRRVESLQLLYEEMTAANANTNEGTIQLGAYLGRVANAIAHLDGRPGVRMNIDVAPVVVETDRAVRIGLIVSELLTNAMQHAFVDQVSGLVELRVTATDDAGLRATVTDDGVGIPDGVDWPDGDSLGGRIVKGLCEGLNATLTVTNGAIGTVVTLEIPKATD